MSGGRYLHFFTYSLRSVSSRKPPNQEFVLPMILPAAGQDKNTHIIMLGPILELWEWIKAHNPGSLFKKKHRLNFITIHCTSSHLFRLCPLSHMLTDSACPHRSLYSICHDHRISPSVPSRRIGIHRRPFLRQRIRHAKRSQYVGSMSYTQSIAC